MKSKGERIRAKRRRRATRRAHRAERLRKTLEMIGPYLRNSLLESAFTDALFPQLLYRPETTPCSD